MNILVEQRGRITVITINRPEVKNAVDRDTSRELAEAFKQFDDLTVNSNSSTGLRRRGSSFGNS